MDAYEVLAAAWMCSRKEAKERFLKEAYGNFEQRKEHYAELLAMHDGWFANTYPGYAKVLSENGRDGDYAQGVHAIARQAWIGLLDIVAPIGPLSVDSRAVIEAVRGEQQGDGGASVKHIQSLMLKWINTRPGNPAEAVWHEIERELKSAFEQPSARVALSDDEAFDTFQRAAESIAGKGELGSYKRAVVAGIKAILVASSAQGGKS